MDSQKEVLFDEKQRAYWIIRGTRFQYKDYTLMLNDEDVQLLNFVVLSDFAARKRCAVVPRDYIDVKEGIVYWPLSTKSNIRCENLLVSFCDSLVEAEVPRSTITYPFRGVNYNITWKAYPMKAVYKDFSEYTYISNVRSSSMT